MFPFEIIFLTKTKFFFLFNSWNSYWFFFSLKTCIVSHECNGIDIITALILNDISPLCRYRMELVLQLKVRIQSWHKHRGCTLIINKSCSSLFSTICDYCQDNASKLLLALMESRHDSENAERILFNLRPRELVSFAVSCVWSVTVVS